MLRPAFLVVLGVLACSCARTNLGGRDDQDPDQQTDDDGLPGDDDGVELPPPLVAITSPARGDTVSGSLTVTGTATSETASVTTIEVSFDAAEYVSAQGTSAWTFVVNTTAVGDGVHTMRARATDSDGTVGYSPLVAVTVKNSVTPQEPGGTTNELTVGYTAYFDPALGRKLRRQDLTPRSSTFSTGSVTVTGCLITSPITIGTANVTLRGCLIELEDADANATAISNFNGRIDLQYVTFATRTDAVSSGTYSHFNGSAPLFDHCDITDVSTAITDTQDGTVIQNSRIVATTTGIQASGVSGNTYANNSIIVPNNGTAAVSLSGAVGRTALIDNTLSGGASHVRFANGASVSRVTVLRNVMDGHTNPQYTALTRPGSLTVVNTPEQQQAQQASILWPIAGDDVNLWDNTAGLTPTRDGETITP